jgi:hypothetical protein
MSHLQGLKELLYDMLEAEQGHGDGLLYYEGQG